MNGDSFGDRMKRYEEASRTVLPRRIPVIVRVDGRAFHTYTRGLERPFCALLMEAMNRVAIELCEEAQGAVMAFVQSDEVSVLIHGYPRHASTPWFDNQVQKIASVSSSIASASMTMSSIELFGHVKPARFDARVFVLPENDVANYFVWRQRDAARNSIQMLARSIYSHDFCLGQNTNELAELCEKAGKPWEKLPAEQRRGRVALRVPDGERMRWRCSEAPLFATWREELANLLKVEDE